MEISLENLYVDIGTFKTDTFNGPLSVLTGFDTESLF